MVKGSIEKLAEEIGFDIGLSDNETQAKLINGLAKGICRSMDDLKRETQICYIVDLLNNSSEEFIEKLQEFIKLKNENK